MGKFFRAKNISHLSLKREKRARFIFVNYLYDFELENRGKEENKMYVLKSFCFPNIPVTISVYLVSFISNIKSESLNN